ncbi:MAG: hypothetical protein Q8R10_09345 [Pseudomonas sp.]|uniref:hypothetical protein n=1 Tax=Pseudomonas sp. TaxID=306 RepID=UPI0027335081|nr:hypothetical protein [Pseudomonas sp.]MDP3846613.1 hypothetical protein [Pseudomonas sp.]
MVPKLNLVALAVMALYTAIASADEPGTSIFSLRSFGTLGIVHSSESKADYSPSFFKPNGPGYSRSWSADVDSLIGVQVTGNFTPQLSAVLQVISEQRYDNSYSPYVEWANIKYQFTPDFSARIGRTVLPAFLNSDSRKVGYTTAWVRPPTEVYSLVPVSNLDGMDLSYRFYVGELSNTVQGNYGQSDSRLPGNAGKALARELWGIANTTQYGAFTTHFAYQKGLVSVEPLNAFFDFFRYFGAEGNALADRYDPKLEPIEFIGVGASYDPGEWFLMSEWGRNAFRSGLIARSGWYVSGGYRLDAFTPYVTFARSRAESESSTAGLTASALPPFLAGAATSLNGALNSILQSNAGQQTLSVGVRWDFTKNMDAKLQFDHTRLDTGATGRLINAQPDFEPGGSFNILSLAVDFVF